MAMERGSHSSRRVAALWPWMVGGQQKLVIPYFSMSGRISVALNFPLIS